MSTATLERSVVERLVRETLLRQVGGSHPASNGKPGKRLRMR